MRTLIINGIILFLLAQFAPGVSVGGIEVGALFVIGVSAFFLFVQPFLKLVLAPLYLLTFGLFGVVVVGVVLYLLAAVLPGVAFSQTGFILAVLAFWLGNGIIH